MKIAFRPQHELVTFAGQRAACLEPKMILTLSPRGIKKLIHLRASAKTVSSSMLLLHDVAPKLTASWRSHETGPQRIRTKFSGETAAIHQPAISVPSTWRSSKPPSVKSLQLGDSIPQILVVVRQVGNIGFFLRLGQRESFSVKPQAHRLVGMGPRWTQGSYHPNSAKQEFLEIETIAPMGSPQVESRDESI